MKVKSLSRVRLLATDPMDCSLPGSSVHGIFQARVLESPFLLENEENSFFKNVQTTWKEKALSLQVLGSQSSRHPPPPPPRAVGDMAHHGPPGAVSLTLELRLQAGIRAPTPTSS